MNNKLSKFKCITIFLVGISATSIPVIASAEWSIVSLGTLGGYASDAYAINNSGQITGNFWPEYIDSSNAFITGTNGEGFTTLGTLTGLGAAFATAINDSCQVVGDSSSLDNRDHAFITGHDGIGMTDLGTLGGLDSSAHGINNSGQVIGDSWITNHTTTHAFITGPNGIGMTDLGTMGGTWSSARSINDSGQVAGVSVITDNTAYHAFITNPNGVGMTDLGTLGGINSEALGINNSGQVVGMSETINGDPHAFITGPDGIGMIDLGAMGADISYALDINNLGQAVGIARFDCSYCRENSFIYSDGVMVNLSKLDEVINSEWTHLIARDINDNGQIVGYGVLHGIEQAFLLSGADDKDFFRTYVETPMVHDTLPLPTPEPESYAMLLAGLGMIGFMTRQKAKIPG